MSDTQMNASGGDGGYTGPDDSAGLHDPASVQRYARELEKLAGAVARDEKRAQELIDAVHSGNAANVEKVFREAGIESRVSIESRVVEPPTKIEGIGEVAADHTETTRTTEHFEVHFDLGPIHLSAGFDKVTDSSTVTT